MRPSTPPTATSSLPIPPERLRDPPSTVTLLELITALSAVGGSERDVVHARALRIVASGRLRVVACRWPL